MNSVTVGSSKATTSPSVPSMSVTPSEVADEDQHRASTAETIGNARRRTIVGLYQKIEQIGSKKEVGEKRLQRVLMNSKRCCWGGHRGVIGSYDFKISPSHFLYPPEY